MKPTKKRKPAKFIVVDASDDAVISRHATLKRARIWEKSAKSYGIQAVIRPLTIGRSVDQLKHLPFTRKQGG